MKHKNLSNEYLSAFCMEISMLLHSGMPVADGLAVLIEDDVDSKSRQLLFDLSTTMGMGHSLSYALEQAGCFPKYVLRMAETGEQAGRLEDTFSALSEYYNNRQKLDTQVRTSLLYPCILMILILVVIVVVLAKIMPVFSQVYAQLGIRMTGLAGGLLKVGEGLSVIMPVLVVLLVIVAAFIAVFGTSRRFSGWLINVWQKSGGKHGIGNKVSAARFASALSIGMASGLPIGQSLELAAAFSDNVPEVAKKYEKCRDSIDNGEGLAQALKNSEIFSAMYCQMISVGVKSGNGASAMAEAARRMEDEAEDFIERRVRSIEPVMIIAVSVIIGIIILSVLLPLINIMSAIG